MLWLDFEFECQYTNHTQGNAFFAFERYKNQEGEGDPNCPSLYVTEDTSASLKLWSWLKRRKVRGEANFRVKIFVVLKSSAFGGSIHTLGVRLDNKIFLVITYFFYDFTILKTPKVRHFLFCTRITYNVNRSSVCSVEARRYTLSNQKTAEDRSSGRKQYFERTV